MEKLQNCPTVQPNGSDRQPKLEEIAAIGNLARTLNSLPESAAS